MHFDKDHRLTMCTAGGDSRAFAELYRKYLPVVTAYLASLNADQSLLEDLAQEVFLRLWEHRGRYRRESSVRAFLCGYAKNVLTEERRRRLRARILSQKQLFESRTSPSDLSAGPESEAYNEELARQVKKAISALPEQQKQAVRIVDIMGVPPDKAAKTSGFLLTTDLR
jgi:RNA polymerase sigma-70 factor (ECF subfamily)